MNYPRTIKFTNPKLQKLLADKADVINIGRAKSEEIEVIEKEMEVLDKEIQEEEKKVDISDLYEKEKAITAKVEDAVNEMNLVKKEIYDRMKVQVPQELHAKYDDLKKKKEDMETERNKVALKAQKYKDKIIPLARKLMKPFLENKYEDFNTLNLVDGELVATIFSHLNDFETTFNKK